jgi:glutathione S-transferase
MHRYVQTIMFPTMVGIIIVDIPDVLDGEDRAYFIESREKRFGKPLAEVCHGREDALKTLNLQLDPFRKAMAENGFLSGAVPAMADYLLFGVLQWARVCSPVQLVQSDDTIASWMGKMLDLHDGLGRAVPARE